jgi:hypothetical protein
VRSIRANPIAVNRLAATLPANISPISDVSQTASSPAKFERGLGVRVHLFAG